MKPRPAALWLGLNVGALTGVLTAMALGARSNRFVHAAAFLSLSVAMAIYVEAGRGLLRRRARGQLDPEVPAGACLRKPVWIWLIDPLSVVGPGAAFGALAAGVGFTGVGLGVLLTFLAIETGIEWMSGAASPTGLTFEREGLRVHIRGATFLIHWSSITSVDREGLEDHRLIHLRILEIGSSIRSVRPDTPRTRRSVWLTVYDGEQPSGKLTLTPWTAGLDGAVLARAIKASVDQAHTRVN